MNMDITNEGGWKKSLIRTELTHYIYSNISSKELKDIIIETSVITGNGKSMDNKKIYTTDKLYLLSPKEIYGINPAGDTLVETRQLDYYKRENVSITNYLKVAKQYNGYNTSQWLRTPTDEDSSFFGIKNSGELVNYDADMPNGFAFAFRIG